jgi:hypothetical protein
MKKNNPKSKKIAGARRRAGKDMPKSAKSGTTLSSLEMEKVIRELHVHQAELESQNEHLRQAQIEATEAPKPVL